MVVKAMRALVWSLPETRDSDCSRETFALLRQVLADARMHHPSAEGTIAPLLECGLAAGRVFVSTCFDGKDLRIAERALLEMKVEYKSRGLLGEARRAAQLTDRMRWWRPLAFAPIV
jgi:hypothetical protein